MSLVLGGKAPEAIAILEMNGEFNPRSGTIPFELGNLYVQQGNKDKAIASFQRVLQLQPNNPQARQRLTELGVRPHAEIKAPTSLPRWARGIRGGDGMHFESPANLRDPRGNAVKGA